MELTTRIPAHSLAVVGAQYPNRDGSDRRFEILLCTPGEPVELVPEPRNRHDENAVAVRSARGVQIGYLTAERCGRIGSILRSGREVQAVFQAPVSWGAWIRVAFDGEVPTVAPIEPAGEPEPDFYPDEVWPDD